MLNANLIIPVTLIVLFFLLHKILSRKQGKLQQHQNNFSCNPEDFNPSLKESPDFQERAFRHISSEIHDNISLTLTLSKIYLQDLDYNNSLQLNDRIHLSLILITKAINDLNFLCKSIDPDLVERFGLISSVQELVNDVQSAAPFAIELKVCGNTSTLSSVEELNLFRIIQEALNNIIRHAKANRVDISLINDGSQLTISIADDGCGINTTPKSKTGSGLCNMFNRARLLNASLIIQPIKPSGTVINLTMPLKTHSLSNAQRQYCY